MSNLTESDFADVFRAFDKYVAAREQLVAAMRPLGIETGNMEPFADFAEIVTAKLFGGELQPRANKGFDVLTTDGAKVQVKSLRVSSDRLEDNSIDWQYCTRDIAMTGGKATPETPLINADQLVIVVFLDLHPYVLLVFPIEIRETFPVVNLKGLFFRHVEQLMGGEHDVEAAGVRVVDLREIGKATATDEFDELESE